jgi:hypothetical protein
MYVIVEGRYHLLTRCSSTPLRYKAEKKWRREKKRNAYRRLPQLTENYVYTYIEAAAELRDTVGVLRRRVSNIPQYYWQ